LAEQSRFMTIPVGKATSLRRVVQAEKVMAQKMFRTPSPNELADYLSLREKEVLDLLQIGQIALTSHEPHVLYNEEAFGDSLEDSTAENPEKGCENSNLVEEVRGALEDLKGREREVLRLNFGMGAAKPLNLEEIAGLMGLSRAQVRRIRDGALENLRRLSRTNLFRELL
jgi:RNA polymerase primary sigma factor